MGWRKVDLRERALNLSVFTSPLPPTLAFDNTKHCQNIILSTTIHRAKRHCFTAVHLSFLLSNYVVVFSAFAARSFAQLQKVVLFHP